MGSTRQETHRPGAFKQTNKTHKTGRHRSKGAVERATQGKTDVKTLSKHVHRELRKAERRNQMQQNRKKKREESVETKRNLGGALGAPILITIIPLQENYDTASIVEGLKSADESANVAVSPCGITHISLLRFKQRFAILEPPIGNTIATLDAAKVSNTVLFVSDVLQVAEDENKNRLIDDWGEEIITACLAQGMPTTIFGITKLESINVKKQQKAKQAAQEAINKWLPEEKVMTLNKPADALNLLRRAANQKQRSIAYRNRRAHLLAENIKYTSGPEDLGTLEISGYVRGVPLSANSLVHIPGLGDHQLSQITLPLEPYPLHPIHTSVSSTPRVLSIADPSCQESLESENIPDPMDAEQTWPTDEELAAAETPTTKKITKRVPKGTSEYQAAWISDDEQDENDSEYEVESNNEMAIDPVDSEPESDAEDDEEYETITISEAPPDEEKYDAAMDMYEEREAMEKLKKAKLDAQFPDEVDTPIDVPAKIRFQKYRGLASFKSTPWDPKENLPYDYARIFQFQNFERTRLRVLRESERSASDAMPGLYVTLHVKNVRQELFDAYRAVINRPLVVFGLLPHENKMSVLNIALKRTPGSKEPIKSKERLVFQCGARRFAACPIFSQHNFGSKHKYERFFQPDSTVVASLFAPIAFPPCPVMCYREKKDGSLELVATGNVISANPDRIVLKRVVLSGSCYKIRKRNSVIRFMFFNREDIKWFKPVALRTKYGFRGHIKEPLGTHGHMKCVFNGMLNSQDTVLMNLYKRVYPKWTYEPLLITGEDVGGHDFEMM